MEIVYLAGAVDFVIPEQARGWRTKASKVLTDHGIHTFDPAAAFNMSRINQEVWLSKVGMVVGINNMALDSSEIMLAEMEFNCQHTGTTEEILRASTQEGKTLVVWNSSPLPSLYLTKIPGIVIKPTLLDCLEYIVELKTGKKLDRSQYADLFDVATSVKQDTPKIKVKLLDDHPLKVAQEKGDLGEIDPAMLLYKKYADDTGFDIICAEDMTIPARGKVNVPTHMAIEPPKGFWYRLVGRSSTFHVHGMIIVEGTIDTQFRGHLYCSLQNMSDEEKTVKAGDSIAQLIFQEVVGEDWEVVIVNDLSKSDRGVKGFGSTTDAKAHILATYQKCVTFVQSLLK